MPEFRRPIWLRRWRAARGPTERRGNGDDAGVAGAALGERRQLTVMFVDLVGSTALAEQHEPEVVRDLISQYRDVANRVISEHQGHVAQYVGDGIMAYFGFPAAHEDDARRAVTAGLELLGELGELGELGDGPVRTQTIELAARVGVHTGLVLVTDIASGTSTDRDAIFGAAPNQAARIQSLTDPGTLAISDDTYEIVRGYFDVESLGTPPMKGIDRSVEVFRVTGPTGAVDRLRAAGGARSPFVGRRSELGRLRARWSEAAAGHSPARARSVLIRGEAGIGKSRLAEAVTTEAERTGGTLLSAFCASDRVGSPLYPLAGLLERRFSVETADDPVTMRAKIETGCAALGIDPIDAASMVTGVLHLSIDGPTDGPTNGPTNGPIDGAVDGDSLTVEDPHVLRERTFSALVGVISADAARSPTMLLVEDLQWADESTLELLGRLIALDPTIALFIVATARPQFDSSLLGPVVDTIDLGRLSGADHRALIEALAAIHGVPEQLFDAIAARSDGNPLFTEELAKSVAGPAGSSAAAATIPRTIRDLLTARLDGLDSRKPLAQAAAVIGREVDVDLLKSVTGLTQRQLATGLAELERAGVIETIPEARPPVTHRFAHALIRDAAYESQEQSGRHVAHLRLAEALRRRPDVDPGLLAQHFDAALVVDEAVAWYLVAGVKAQTEAADSEAIRHLDRGLELVASLSPDEGRDTQEFNLRVARGTSHVNTKGYGAREAADDYRHALTLSERVGVVTDIVPATAAIWAYYLVHGDLRGSSEAVDRLRAMRRPELDAEIFCCEGVQRFFEGRIADSRTLLEASVEAFGARPPAAEVSQRWLLPSDSLAVALTHLGCVLWLMGEPAAAQRRFDAADERAQSLPPYPTGAFTQAYVSSYAAWIEILAARFEIGRALHEKTTAIAERYGMLFWIAAGRSGHAIGSGLLGEHGTVLGDLRASMELWQSLGAEAFLPFVETQRARLRLLMGEPNAALDDVDVALAHAERTTEHFFTAEAHRLRAAILLALDRDAIAAARAELLEASAVAHAQGALVFELRAAIDRFDLDARQGGARDDALLRDVLARMPDGCDLADVDRARALVDG